MATQTYTEFEWQAATAGNGASGERLTSVFVELVTRLEGVKSICDLGCGNGHIAGRLAALGYDVTGVDASISGLRIARQFYPQPKFVERHIDAELNDLGQCDLVISSDVIEHLYRPGDLLEAAQTLLKPNGQVLIGTPYHGYLKNLALAVTGRMDAHFSSCTTAVISSSSASIHCRSCCERTRSPISVSLSTGARRGSGKT